MAKKSGNNVGTAITEIRQLLAEWLETSNKASKPVARILRLIDIIEGEVRPGAVKRTRGREGRRYFIEDTATGPLLAEGKIGETSPPFKVSKAIYDATIEVLVSAESPMLFEELLQNVASKIAVPPADYHIRVPLRFWMSLSPPLVHRARKKYHPVERSHFASAAVAAWKALCKSRP